MGLTQELIKLKKWKYLILLLTWLVLAQLSHEEVKADVLKDMDHSRSLRVTGNYENILISKLEFRAPPVPTLFLNKESCCQQSGSKFQSSYKLQESVAATLFTQLSHSSVNQLGYQEIHLCPPHPPTAHEGC